MDIGMGLLTGQRRPDDSRPISEIYQEMVHLAKRAETAGLDSVWASEHHFADDAYLPSLATTIGAIASVTDEIALGTSMMLAPLHDPIRLAEDTATVSALSEGRFIVGLANGYRESEFKNFGVPMQERSQRTEEAVKILRGAWSPGPLDYEPQFATVSDDVTITPKPDEEPPIVMGGTAKPVLRRAGLVADGWVAPEKISVEDIAKRKRYVEKLRRVEKRDNEFTVYIQQYCFVADSETSAWNRIEESVEHVNAMYGSWKRGDDRDYAPPAEKMAEIRERAILGSPSDVIDQLRRYEEVLGSDIHLILRVYHPGVGTERMERCLELLGDEVIPAVR